MKTVVVFDYGFGNVRSMVRALADQGLDVTLTSDYRQALEADGLVVPGVGAYGACMEGLRKVSGDRVIYDRLRADRPVLGVCVGEQIMFTQGEEHGVDTEGLGLIGGAVTRLDADVVPHMAGTPCRRPKDRFCSTVLRTNGSTSCTRTPHATSRRPTRANTRSISPTPPSAWHGAPTGAAFCGGI